MVILPLLLMCLSPSLSLSSEELELLVVFSGSRAPPGLERWSKREHENDGQQQNEKHERYKETRYGQFCDSIFDVLGSVC